MTRKEAEAARLATYRQQIADRKAADKARRAAISGSMAGRPQYHSTATDADVAAMQDGYEALVAAEAVEREAAHEADRNRELTYDDIYSELRVAALAAGFMAPSDAQVRYLARLAFEAGAWEGISGHLKRGEASILIDNYLSRREAK